ncbi:MAG: hypothetical protein GY809_31945 [Planctomycetes bacterium]|nr:hypothetical protein [Planctomycetota bacterium]
MLHALMVLALAVGAVILSLAVLAGIWEVVVEMVRPQSAEPSADYRLHGTVTGRFEREPDMWTMPAEEPETPAERHLQIVPPCAPTRLDGPSQKVQDAFQRALNGDRDHG